jgi:hypothetical protein
VPINPSRRALIEHEWRPSVHADAAILALYPEARDIVINSALDTNALATTFGTTLFNLLKVPRRRYSVTIEGALTYKPSNWSANPPTITLKSARYGVPAGLLGIIVGAIWDFQKDEITLEVWG